MADAADRHGQPSRHPADRPFDGVLGVLGAPRGAARALVEAGYETHAPIEVINWTNEEGSRRGRR